LDLAPLDLAPLDLAPLDLAPLDLALLDLALLDLALLELALLELALLELGWMEGRRQRRHRHVDLDLGGVDLGAFVEPVGDRARPEDQDDDQDQLQEQPGNGAPVDFRGLDGGWSDAAQIEQGKAEGRVHEARLNIGANEHAEPNQIDAELVGRRRQQGDDDEGDLEEIQEEGDHEDEGVDEHQEAHLTARQRGQQLLDPLLAADALEHQAEHPRPDQDVDHHGGDAHGAGHAFVEKLPR